MPTSRKLYPEHSDFGVRLSAFFRPSTLALRPSTSASVLNRIANPGSVLFHAGVPKVRFFIRYWLPALVWMVVIFSASSDTGSFRHSSRLIAPLLHWLFPHLPEPSVNNIVFIARKGAHLTEYAILGLLLWRALRTSEPKDGWQRRAARRAVLLVLLYAATDEFHQLFVPSRQGSVIDVLIDTSGAVLGLVCLWSLGRWRAWW